MNKSIQKQFIPEGWKSEKLDDLFDILIGGTPSRKKQEYWDKDKITGNTWVSIADLSKNETACIDDSKEYISDLGVKNSNVKLVPANTVIMSFKLSVGKTAITKKELYTNEAIAAFIPKDNRIIDYRYLYFVISLLDYEIDSAIKGKTLNKSKIQKAKILLPPLKVQEKIAQILMSVDEEIEKTEQVIKKTEELKKGLMQELFSKGIGHTKFKKTEIGMVPEEWKVTKLKKLVNFTTGKLNANAAEDNGKYPFFTCAQKTYKINTYSFDQKAILLSGNNANAIYSIKYYDGKFNAYQRTYVISILDKNILDYIFLKENLNFRLNDLKDASFGTSTKFLTLALLQNIYVALPTIKEQKQIANILASVDEKIEKNKQTKKKLKRMKKGLMQDLLSGRVRVNYED